MAGSKEKYQAEVEKGERSLKVSVLVDFTAAEGTRLLPCGSSGGLDEFDFEMRSEPVLFASSRGKLLKMGLIRSGLQNHVSTPSL